jgi:hypothetical protein
LNAGEREIVWKKEGEKKGSARGPGSVHRDWGSSAIIMIIMIIMMPGGGHRHTVTGPTEYASKKEIHKSNPGFRPLINKKNSESACEFTFPKRPVQE